VEQFADFHLGKGSHFEHLADFLPGSEPERSQEEIAALLGEKGYRVLTATDGSEGLKTFSQNSVQLVISDMNMPKMNGLVALPIVKRNSPGVKVLVLTGRDENSYIMAALRAGAGLVTVASTQSALPVIAAHAPELMTEPLPETAAGAISMRAFEPDALLEIAKRKTVLAVGPGGDHRGVFSLSEPLVI
jgi:CheY-like chemotaxis protein